MFPDPQTFEKRPLKVWISNYWDLLEETTESETAVLDVNEQRYTRFKNTKPWWNANGRGSARGGGVHVACLNFKTSHVGVYKCLSLIVGFAATVTIWPREVVSCGDFIWRAVATFWAMSLVGIYPGRALWNASHSYSQVNPPRGGGGYYHIWAV